MKSSSSLFPVALMRAEVLSSNYIEDTYLLKPNNSPDPTVQIAVSRFGFKDRPTEQRGAPVVLVHGLYSNRSCWLDSELNGLAAELLEQGFDPWMLEFRGHGDSPVNLQNDNNSLEMFARFDIPATQQFIDEKTNQKAIWIGHGAGGVSIVAALTETEFNQDKVAGLVLFNSQVSSYPLFYYVPFVKTIKKIGMLFKKIYSNSSYGPEVESKGIIKEYIRWAGLFTRWKSRQGRTYWKALTEVTVPLIAFSAKKDKQNPEWACRKLALAINNEAEFVVLSKATGFKKDYKYLEPLVADIAKEEVWPVLTKWISSLN